MPSRSSPAHVAGGARANWDPARLARGAAAAVDQASSSFHRFLKTGQRHASANRFYVGPGREEARDMGWILREASDDDVPGAS